MPRGGQGAGRYWERVRHWVRTTSPDSGTGFKRPTYEVGNTLWAWTEYAKPTTVLAYGVLNKQVEIIIHLRAYPPVDSLDRFEILTSGSVVEPKGGIKYDYDTGETVLACLHIPTIEATHMLDTSSSSSGSSS